jgi:hypothetical protein
MAHLSSPLKRASRNGLQRPRRQVRHFFYKGRTWRTCLALHGAEIALPETPEDVVY